MRSVKVLGISIFICFSVSVYSQGTTCTNAITIPLDGSCNNYSVSSNGGNPIHCTGGPYGGGAGGKVTYFKFTTDAIPQCVLLDMTTSVAGTSIEAVLFSGCLSGNPTGGDAYQSLCIDDGDGIWASNLWYDNLNPNSTYYLRVRTESGFTGSIQICGKYNTPSNNLCSGATSIDPSDIDDNNACNVGSSEVAPGNLCAGSLENTSWYSYTIDMTGVSNLIIGNLNCDNANFPGNNDYGFQIGFFTGSCGSLTPAGCYAATGSAGGQIIANTNSYPSGTVIHVAIDGFAGSNCSYTIQAINAIPLPVKLRYFVGWKGPDYNLLRWVTSFEKENAFFEIERSEDGVNYSTIGSVQGNLNSTSDQQYSFKDPNPVKVSYYRLRQIDINGRSTYSRIVSISRENYYTLKALFSNPVRNSLKLNIETPQPGNINLLIVDVSGRSILTEMVSCHKGVNTYFKDLSNLPAGSYYLVLTQEGYRKTYPFIKQ